MTVQDDYRQLIYDALLTVDNIGQVYDYERWTNDWGVFLDLYKIRIGGQDVIRGWDIAYRGFPMLSEGESQLTFGGIDSLRVHQFVVQGFLQIDDENESEKAVSELAVDVVNTLESDTVLSSAGYAMLPCTVDVSPRTYGGVTVHGIRIVVRIMEYHAS